MSAAADAPPSEVEQPQAMPSLCSGCGAPGPLTDQPEAGYVCSACRREPPEEVAASLLEEAGGELDDLEGVTGLFRDYEVLELLRQGGYGVVYKARDTRDGELVALKLLLPERAASPAQVTRFQREIHLHSRIFHNNVVQVREHGRVQKGSWMALEYCAGGSLYDLLRRRSGPLGPREAADLFIGLLGPLGTLHLGGEVHRDIKPANILLTADEKTAKLADFGLAKSFTAAGLSGLTHVGQRVGSWRFAPQEQVSHFIWLDPAADIWSMAASLYFALTCRHTRDFPSKPGPEDQAVLLTTPVVPIRERAPHLSPELVDVIDGALRVPGVPQVTSAVEFRNVLIDVAYPDQAGQSS